MVNPKTVPSRTRVFIGSSTEGLEVAKLVNETLHQELDCILWNDHRIFGPGEFTIEGLEKALDICSHAIIVMSPDDETKSRGKKHLTPRDNLIFELGLFVGRYGRKSAFMMIPHGQQIKLPSDLMGITPSTYKTTQIQNTLVPDVATACSQISREIKKDQGPSRKLRPAAANFWGNLGQRVVIVFGVEQVVSSNPKEHPRVSLRDLTTAHHLFGFINRHFPKTNVELCPAGTTGWQNLLQQENTVVILIGGFVTNKVFAQYREQYQESFEENFRVKMGRLCRVEGQRVYHLRLEQLPGIFIPPRSEPYALENIPSEQVSQDFGLVTSRTAFFYENARRVITITGVKGNGTRAAAMLLTKEMGQLPNLDSILPGTLTREDAFEMAVMASVSHDSIVALDIIEATLNGRRIFSNKAQAGEKCEQNRSCTGCNFGLLNITGTIPEPVFNLKLSRRGVNAIIFDLDDTLVDTFTELITPIEAEAAKRMVRAGLNEPVENVLDILLLLRRSNPDNLEEMLRQRIPQTTEKVLEARRVVLAEAPSYLNRLKMKQSVVALLQRLAARYKLYLLTAGPPEFQSEKIKVLKYAYNIHNLFREFVVIDSASSSSKQSAIADLVKRYKRESVLVVGNRLEHEIRAAHNLGMKTVWVRYGEGSSLKPDETTGQPTYIINDINELSDILL